ncbi:hypothetical protein [Winogradskyella aquimaris]|uniref:Lipocalin-like domain-containing protein n=1 Tax=Winogradskyella aquimaris TaxID=864074 RepID=A0ABU5ER73_9FLAO|nr:hypothetical protein [Winogradskyella aquimaris]MDY2587371.1 hypothetical protein [Winogradskyella aquimaris]
MKKVFNLGFILMLSITLMSSMCSSDDDDGTPNNNSQQIAEIENDVQSGTWIITNFVDSGQDETSDFNGYDFSFNADGTLVATNGTNTMTGTWSVTDDDSSDDDSSSSSDIDFNIFFPVPDTNDFEDLNDDWDIVTSTSTRIELIDISGGNGGTDLLTFEKN